MQENHNPFWKICCWKSQFEFKHFERFEKTGPGKSWKIRLIRLRKSWIWDQYLQENMNWKFLAILQMGSISFKNKIIPCNFHDQNTTHQNTNVTQAENYFSTFLNHQSNSRSILYMYCVIVTKHGRALFNRYEHTACGKELDRKEAGTWREQPIMKNIISFITSLFRFCFFMVLQDSAIETPQCASCLALCISWLSSKVVQSCSKWFKMGFQKYSRRQH